MEGPNIAEADSHQVGINAFYGTALPEFGCLCRFQRDSCFSVYVRHKEKLQQVLATGKRRKTEHAAYGEFFHEVDDL